MTKMTLGGDVSKTKLDAALWLGVSHKWSAAKSGNDAAGALTLFDRLRANSGLAATDCRVVVEATGVYHEAVEQDLQREEKRLEKAQATATRQPVQDSLHRSLTALPAEREHLRRTIEDHYDQHPGLNQERARLNTIPGVGNVSANRLLCLLKRHPFDSARQAAACAALIPVGFDTLRCNGSA